LQWAQMTVIDGIPFELCLWLTLLFIGLSVQESTVSSAKSVYSIFRSVIQVLEDIRGPG
jgi:hypothetical protein